MRRRLLWMIPLALVVVAGGLCLRVLWLTGTFRRIHPHFAGSCRLVRGPVGPEDITIHPRTGIAYISASDRPAVDAGRPVPGAIYGYDGVTRPAPARRIAEPMLPPRDPPIRVRRAIPTSWVELVLREGRNRQVRRMTAAVGHPTLRLIRYAIGPWTLTGLQPGACRELGADELAGALRGQRRPR